MILLVTASARAQECATSIEQKTHQKVTIAGSLSRVIGLLQTHEYDVLVLDESFQQLEAGVEGLLTTHAGMAVPIYVNLSLHGSDRIALDVKRGVERLTTEKLAAMRAAELLLRNELRGEVTGILLNSELALRERPLSPGVAQKLDVIHDLAERMRRKLEGVPVSAFVRPAVAKAGVAARAQ
jgi:hypothetical protein